MHFDANIGNPSFRDSDVITSEEESLARRKVQKFMLRARLRTTDPVAHAEEAHRASLCEFQNGNYYAWYLFQDVVYQKLLENSLREKEGIERITSVGLFWELEGSVRGDILEAGSKIYKGTGFPARKTRELELTKFILCPGKTIAGLVKWAAQSGYTFPEYVWDKNSKWCYYIPIGMAGSASHRSSGCFSGYLEHDDYRSNIMTHQVFVERHEGLYVLLMVYEQ